MRPPRGLATALAVAAVAVAATADELIVGGQLGERAFEDQHGKGHVLDDRVKLVVFTRDMDAGDLVKEALAERDTAWLEARGVAYVSDVSGMPGLIFRAIARPRMRKRPYLMWLDRDGDLSADFPREQGKVTLLTLNALRVEAIAFAGSAAEVTAALEAMGGEPEAE